MILTGAIQNTHYNLIDTLITLIPKWDEYANKIIPLIKENANDLVSQKDNSLIPTSLLHLSNHKEVEAILPYDSGIRYTIIECMVWGYFQRYRMPNVRY